MAQQQQQSLSDTNFLQPIEINAVRASDALPVAKTNLTKQDIAKQNVGYDLPFILNQTPSIQVNADAGNGIGYTGFRIRGTDASRINITINGIPYNDAESQGTFLVNLPDMASSAQSIQIQRGVGTSTNGSGAFGASININTNELDTLKSLSFQHALGSYNAQKHTWQVNSGLIKKHLVFTGRLSQISSDGYVERAKAKLQSFYSSIAYVNQHQSLRLNIFSGKEKTYAAWFGINQTALDTNRRYNPAGTEQSGSPYDNETDNYTQTHYQLFYNTKFSAAWKGNVAVFLTKGKGYFEQYKAAQTLSNYGLPPFISGTDTITQTDLIRQLWLDNSFYGTNLSLQFDKQKRHFIAGAALNSYDGKHFGIVVGSATAGAIPASYQWYLRTAKKTEGNVFLKWTEQLHPNWQSFVDLQYRQVHYGIKGFKDNPTIVIAKNYAFFNPKFGLTHTSRNGKIYLSYAKASKEPNRDDFETSSNNIPKPEILHDFELGVEQKYKKWNWSCNLYYMHYVNQLVLTGKVNEVFAYTRTNIPKSYRAGVELESRLVVNKWMNVASNLTISRNKIFQFTAYVDDYDNGNQQTKTYNQTDISFSPAILASASINFKALKAIDISFSSKYVGKQFLDNTSGQDKKLNAYFVENLQLSYSKKFKRHVLDFFVQFNNLLSEKYVANGYTFSYIYGGKLNTENYYYPMATLHCMTGLGIRF